MIQNYQSLADNELLKLLPTDRHVFDFIYKKYHHEVTAFAISFFPGCHAIEDCVQDTWATLYTKGSRGELNHYRSIAGFMKFCVRNRLVNHHNYEKRFVSFDFWDE